MADDCTSCGEDLGGVYQYYWGLPYHPECCPANIAEARERARQRRIGRDEATRATPPAAVVEAMERALRGISELNLTAEDENGHKWANSELIDQEITFSLAQLEAWRDAQ